MSDRFDLEQRILQIGTFSSLLRDLTKCVLEYDITTDEIANALEGIAVALDNHEKITFDIFTQVLELDRYNATNS